MRTILLLASAALLASAPVMAKPKKSPVVEGQAPHAGVAKGYRYQLHIPQGYKASKTERWPLIIFLHGSGERGDDIEKVKIHGPPKIAGDDLAFPFIVISPQLPEGEPYPKGGFWEPAKLDATLDAAVKNLRVDTSRIYLTGLSLGGMGTWAWAAARPERFAAIAPVAARADTTQACKLKDMPIWVFHGDSDPVVPTKGDIDMAQAVEQCGGKPRLTIYPATGHDSWTATYANAELYLWFLRHRKGAAKKP